MNWPSTRVLQALQRVGWTIKRQSGSHRTLKREGWSDYVFAFHDSEEIGPRMLARIATKTGSGRTIFNRNAQLGRYLYAIVNSEGV